MGLPVIALNGKTPNTHMHRNGLKDALGMDSNGEVFERSFRHPWTTGIGIVIPFPYLVVDIDGEAGARNWIDNYGDIPDRWVAKTGRGLHLWYACMEPTGSGRLAEQLDLKGQGGYVAAPPSQHPDGHRYTWLAEPSLDYPPMEAPPALVRWITLRNADQARARLAKEMLPRVHHAALEDGILYPTLGWEALVAKMAEAGSGNRNNYLHWAAATMAEEHATDEDLQALYDAAIAAGLTRRETLLTIRSAMKAAAR
jgi:hypothetical protein